jgi:hypothetical protein
MSSRVIVFLLLLAFASPVSASEERAIEIAQPIADEDGIVLSRVTYVVHDDVDSWGRLVDYTCKEGFVGNDEGKAENRNAANITGIKAWVDPYHFQEQALFGDTVRVYIDLTSFDPKKLGWREEYARSVVDATLECVLVNATSSREGWYRAKNARITAKHLHVEVRGAPEFKRLTQTYPFSDLVGKVPRSTHFGPEGNE